MHNRIDTKCKYIIIAFKYNRIILHVNVFAHQYLDVSCVTKSPPYTYNQTPGTECEIREKINIHNNANAELGRVIFAHFPCKICFVWQLNFTLYYLSLESIQVKKKKFNGTLIVVNLSPKFDLNGLFYYNFLWIKSLNCEIHLMHDIKKSQSNNIKQTNDNTTEEKFTRVTLGLYGDIDFGFHIRLNQKSWSVIFSAETDL